MGVCIRWLLTHGSTIVYDCIRISSCTDEGRTDHMAILSPTFYPRCASFCRIYDIIQYSADVVGTDRWGNILERFITNSLKLPDTGRTFVVHVSSAQPLLVYPCHIAMAEKSFGERRAFLYRAVRSVNLYAVS